MSFSLRVFLTKVARRFHDISDLARGALFVIDATVREASETTVRIEEYLFRPVVLQRSFRVSDNRLAARRSRDLGRRGNDFWIFLERIPVCSDPHGQP